ncbi:unnamed protein product, partial [Symbiodinium pilosum]
ELLVEAQIPPELRHEFLHFTPAEFAPVAVDLEDLNKFIDELVFPPDMPRLDLLAVDDVPQRDLSLQHMSRTVMQEILDLHATAIALVGGAHFHTLREMNRRFLAKACERYGSDTGLRCPNHAEAMQADQKLWQSISSLINDEGWCMDDAIHEVVVVRNEIATLLMPRPNPPKLPASWVLRKGGLKGLGKGKGKGAKGGKSAKGSGVQVNGLQIATFYKKGQEKHLLCNDFSKGKCTRPNYCKFEHKCGVWLPDGSICLQDHTPLQHKKTAH